MGLNERHDLDLYITQCELRLGGNVESQTRCARSCRCDVVEIRIVRSRVREMWLKFLVLSCAVSERDGLGVCNIPDFSSFRDYYSGHHVEGMKGITAGVYVWKTWKQ